MTKAEKLIHSNSLRIIRQHMKYMNCDHSWYQSGHGYKCRYCGFYSGTHTALNKVIEKEYRIGKRPKNP